MLLGGRVQDVAVDEQGADRLAGRVPVGLLDGLVHPPVRHQVGRPDQIHVLRCHTRCGGVYRENTNTGWYLLGKRYRDPNLEADLQV